MKENRLSADTIEAVVSEALIHFEEGNLYKGLSCLHEIRGMAEQVLEIDSLKRPYAWGNIQSEYEKGVKPGVLSQKYGIPAKKIRQKAWTENWLNPKKLTKAVMKISHRTFYYPICQSCKNQFEVKHKSAIICPTCIAAEKLDKHRGYFMVKAEEE